MVTIIQRAERLPNGRVVGEGPAALVPEVLRVLSQAELARYCAVKEEQRAVNMKTRALFSAFGLDPRRKYRIRPTGEVIEIGRHRPLY